MNKKYPTDLFVIGVIMNIIGHFFYLFIPSLILMIVGIWVKWCLFLGIALLVIDVILSIIAQMNIKKATLNSDNPNFTPWQEAILSEDWRKNTQDLIDEKVSESEKNDDKN